MNPCKLALPALLAVILTACATTPDPAEVCSAEWIKPRVDAAMKDFNDNSGEIFDTLLDMAEKQVKSGGDLGIIGRMGVALNMIKLVNMFQNGQTFKDLKTLGNTCDDPQLAINALTGMVRGYELPETFVTLLTELEEFGALLGAIQQ